MIARIYNILDALPVKLSVFQQLSQGFLKKAAVMGFPSNIMRTPKSDSLAPDLRDTDWRLYARQEWARYIGSDDPWQPKLPRQTIELAH